MKENDCSRAIMVAHNATFDHSFTMAAAERASLKRNPFHPFVTFDTAALSGLALGQTVLSKACITAGIAFDGTGRIPRYTTPSVRRSCSVRSSTAGNVWAAGRCRWATRPIFNRRLGYQQPHRTKKATNIMWSLFYSRRKLILRPALRFYTSPQSL